MNKLFVIIAVCLLSLTAYAERWEYIAYVGDTIYDPALSSSDTLPVDDSIFVPIHVNIEDINIFVGIDTRMFWSDKIDILVYSPQGVLVYLSHYGPGGPRRPSFNMWFDTQDSVDGPGMLQDYNGSDVYGWWRMRCYSVSCMPPNAYWSEWRIEVYGTTVGIISSDPNIPAEYYLGKPYPNPLNGKTVLKFGLPQAGQANITIYDVLGRKICTLLDNQLDAGNHQIAFDAMDLASGVYFAKLRTNGQVFTQRLTLIK